MSRTICALHSSRRARAVFDSPIRLLRFLIICKHPALPRRVFELPFFLTGGALSSVNILMTECLGELISESATGTDQFAHPLAYIFIGILIVSNVSEVFWMQRALQLFDALIVVPMFSVTVSVLSILTGAMCASHAHARWTTSQYSIFTAPRLLSCAQLLPGNQ